MAGYTRNDTSNNIANGNVIDADDLDGEFNAIESAFDESTGHTHDGTSAEGAPITVTGPNQEYLSDAVALYPKTDDTYDLGKTGAEWKDLYINGTANIDSLVADTVDVNGGTIDGTIIGGTTPAAISGTTGTFTGNVTVSGTVDGRDVSADGTKLDTVETNADVTDTANVTAAGALMDSELTNIAAVKSLNQGVSTTDNPTFAEVSITGDLTVDTSTFFVDASTNRVGIGQATPLAELDVSGDVRLSGRSTENQSVTIGAGRTDNGISFIDLVGDTTYSDYGLRVVRQGSGSDTNSQIIHRGTGSLRLNSQDAGSVVVLTDNIERMRIDSSGNVGIGTSIPAHQFEVENSTGSAIIAATSSTTGVTQIRMGDTANTGEGRVEYDNSINAMSLHTAGSERMTITSTGDVGIGTTTPGSKLSVIGLPTSSAGLSAGDIWNDSGTLKIVT